MPIDPSIPLRAVSREPRRDPMRRAANMLQIQQMQRKNALEDDERKRKAAMDQALGEARDPVTGKIDLAKARDVMWEFGDRDTAMEIDRRLQADEEKASAPPTERDANLGGGLMGRKRWNRATRAWELVPGSEYEPGVKGPKSQAQALERSAAGKTTVRVGGASIIQQKEADKKVGGFYGDLYVQAQQGELEGRKQFANLKRLDQLMEGMETGTFTATRQSVGKALTAMGVDPKKMGFPDTGEIGRGEAATALSAQMALELRNPAGGAGMPGAMSDKDREFLQSMVPGLATTREGRRLMVQTKSKLLERDKQVARMAREYRKRNGNMDEGFLDELSAWSEQNEMFGDMRQAGAESAPTLSGSRKKMIEQYNAIPKNSQYIDPNGNLKTKLY